MFNSFYNVLIIFILIFFIVLIIYFLVSKNNTHKFIKSSFFISPKIYAFLIKIGLVHATPFLKSFIKFLYQLKNHSSSSNYKYLTPWYLLIGPSNSGKTNILRNFSNFQNQYNDPSQNAGNSYCEWFNYNDAIVIEVSSNSVKSNGNWQLLTELLHYFRHKRPIDGIILTIPLDLLLNEEEYPGSRDTIYQNIFENIWQFQLKTNSKLPLYIIFTKTDLVDGIKNLLQMLSIEEKNQIFGWANKYNLDEIYSSSWIDEAFNSINKSLNNFILKIAAKTSTNSSFEEILFVKRNFQKLKSPIKKMINSIFKTFNIENSLILRGIFFTAYETESSVIHISDKTPSQGTNELYITNFIKDLFSKKIFVESNLTQPLYRNENFKQTKFIIKNILIYLSILLLTIGGYLEHKNVRNNFALLYNKITLINSSVYTLKQTKPNQKIILDQELQNILHTISELNNINVKSFLIPISWFTDIHKDIKKSISQSFDTAIINSIYLELNLKTNDITKKIASKNYIKNKFQYNILNSEPFIRLDNYISKVLSLQKISKEYNALLKKDKFEVNEHLNSITSFLFSKKFNIENFLNNDKENKINTKYFSLAIYSEIIKENIKVLFNDFINSSLSELYLKIFQNLESTINNSVITLNDKNQNINQINIQLLLKKIDNVIKFISSNQNEWLSNDNFAPGKKFSDLISKLSTIKIIDNKFIQNLQGYANEQLLLFKQKLLKYHTSLTGHFLKHQKQKVFMCPSDQFVQFYNNMNLISKEPFMVNSTKCALNNNIPETKLLFWDKNILDNIAALINRFNSFKNSKISTMHYSNKYYYINLCKSTLIKNIINMLYKAQTFENIYSTNNLNNKIELLKNNIQNFSTIKTQLLCILEFFNSDFSAEETPLLNLIKSYYSRILLEANTLFEKIAPYETNISSIKTWNGYSNICHLLFNINNNSTITEYLKIQNNIVKTLTKDIVEPILTLLSDRRIVLPMECQFIIQKWRKLIQCENSYLEKNPKNSILELENFLTTTLSNINYKNFKNFITNNNPTFTEEDFFLRKKSRLLSALKNRILEVEKENFIKTYNNIAELFNSKLSGTFPFVKAKNPYTEDASPELVSLFLKEFDTYISEDLINFLTKEYQKTNSTLLDAALKFLKDINTKKTLLTLIIKNKEQKENNKNKILLSVKFDSPIQKNSCNEEIIESNLHIGDSIIKYLNNQNQTIEWHSGDEIKCTFKWALNGYEIPYTYQNNSLSVNANKATFSYNGPWSILKFFQDTLNPQKTSNNEYILRFLIPTTSKRNKNLKKTAKIFISIKIDLNLSDKIQPVYSLTFPHFAPKIIAEKL